MDENTKRKNEKIGVRLYAINTTLYYNELICSTIEDLEEYIKKKDSETQKIYRALTRRVEWYKDKIEKIYNSEEDRWFRADINSIYDEALGRELDLFQKAIANVYRRNGIYEFEFLSKLETCRTIILTSMSTMDCMIESAHKHWINIEDINAYRLSEMPRIIENLSEWCYRNVHTKNEIKLQTKKSVMEHYHNILNIVDQNTTSEKAYQKAIQYQKERNQQNK